MSFENQEQLVPNESFEAESASRWSRLFASIIDTLILCCLLLPVMFLTGMFSAAMAGGGALSLGYNLIMGALTLIIFVLVNGKLLVSKGQTIGKKILNIKIVDMNGNLPVLNDHLLKRYAVFFLPGQVPYVGGIFGIINVLFIFGAEKRCVHDLVANTRVVNC